MTSKFEQRRVPADLIEAAPNPLGQWALASPLLLLLAWTFLDLFVHFSPSPYRWLEMLVGSLVFLALIVLPLGLLAHLFVTSFPRLFQNAGWDIQPLETVTMAEQYMVHYVYRDRHRAPNSWRQMWLRVAQGWVYLEIFAIFAGFLAMPLIFFSALEFGFGK